MTKWQRMLVSGRCFIDLSEFIDRPLRSGIQRIGAALCRYVSEDFVPVYIRDQETVSILDDRIFDRIDRYFGNAQDVIGTISRDLHAGSSRVSGIEGEIQRARDEALFSLSVEEFAKECRAFFTSELFFDENRIKFYRAFLKINKEKLFISVNDFIPWLHPEYFPQFDVEWAEGLMSYIHMLREARHVSFISEATKSAFVKRIARHSDGDFHAFQLGADGLGRAAPQPAENSRHFVVLGTVEPRKKSIFILNLFEELIEQGVALSLTFLGKSQQLTDAELEYFEETIDGIPGFSWKRGLDDAFVREEIATARACLYISEMEGAGLPPLESLALGVPVIVSEGLPSLSGLPSAGQIRIDPNDREQLRAAVLRLLDDQEAERLRHEISLLALPTWEQFSRSTMDWIFQTTQKTQKTVGMGTAASPLTLSEALRVIKEVRQAEAADPKERIFALSRLVLGTTPAGADLREFDSWASANLTASQVAIKVVFKSLQSGVLDPAAAEGILDVLLISDCVPDDAPEFIRKIEREHLDAKLAEVLALIELEETRLVDRAHLFCFGRNADKAERDHYVGSLRTRENSRCGVVLELLKAPETEDSEELSGILPILKTWIGVFDGFYSALIAEDGDEHFVVRAYRCVVGRTPDSEGEAEYLLQLSKGLPREMLLLSLLTSEEGLKHFFDSDVVERLIAWLLGRMRDNPSSAGFVRPNWMEAVSAVAALADYLDLATEQRRSSGEFSLLDAKTLLGIKGNNAFLKACYSRLFRRAADEEGLKGYKVLLSRQPRAFILSALLRSDEFRDKSVAVGSGVLEFLASSEGQAKQTH